LNRPAFSVFREISLPIRRSTVFGALKSRVALWLLLAKYGEVSSNPMRNYGETNQTQHVFSLAVSHPLACTASRPTKWQRQRRHQ
jgi:hypothetical protein